MAGGRPLCGVSAVPQVPHTGTLSTGAHMGVPALKNHARTGGKGRSTAPTPQRLDTHRTVCIQALRNWAHQGKASYLQKAHQIPAIKLFSRFLGLTQGRCINTFRALISGFWWCQHQNPPTWFSHVHKPTQKKRGESTQSTSPSSLQKKPWQQPTLPPHHRAVPSA